MILDLWAERWGIAPAAIKELREQCGIDYSTVHVGGKDGSESRQQALVRIEAANLGVWLTRNNVGVLIDKEGRPVRYGLANESKKQNEKVKSADLIGIRPILIGPQHVGKIIGQFVSREVKEEGWRFTGHGRETAQLAWLNFVNTKGGDAAFCSGQGSFNFRE